MEFKEAQNPNHIPSFEDVSIAYADIANHNRLNTGLAGAMRATIGAMLSRPESIDDTSPSIDSDDFNDILDEHLDQSIVEGEMSAELQGIMHSDTFMRIGIDIAPLGGYSIDDNGKKTSSDKLLPLVHNTQLFKEFLATTEPEDISLQEEQLPQAVLGSLNMILDTLLDPAALDQLPDELKDNVDSYVEDTIRIFIELEPEYERLGLDADSLREKFSTNPGPTSKTIINDKGFRQAVPVYDDAEKQKAHVDEYHRYSNAQKLAKTHDQLVGYVTHWGQRVLPEYARANRADYLTKPESQGFGPARWHTDGGQYKWAAAFEFLEELGQEERTLEFREEVREGLIGSLDAALDETDNAQREDLINVRNALTFEPFDQAKLEAYIKKPDNTNE